MGLKIRIRSGVRTGKERIDFYLLGKESFFKDQKNNYKRFSSQTLYIACFGTMILMNKFRPFQKF